MKKIGKSHLDEPSWGVREASGCLIELAHPIDRKPETPIEHIGIRPNLTCCGALKL